MTTTLRLSLRPYRPRRRPHQSLQDMPPAQSYESWLEGWKSALRDRTPFRSSSSVSAIRVGSGRWDDLDPGRLPSDWARTFVTRSRAGVITYVVRSYATPIAWFDTEAGWVVPDEGYSVTTSKQQSLVRRVLADLGEEWQS